MQNRHFVSKASSHSFLEKYEYRKGQINPITILSKVVKSHKSNKEDKDNCIFCSFPKALHLVDSRSDNEWLL